MIRILITDNSQVTKVVLDSIECKVKIFRTLRAWEFGSIQDYFIEFRKGYVYIGGKEDVLIFGNDIPIGIPWYVRTLEINNCTVQLDCEIQEIISNNSIILDSEEIDINAESKL